MSATLQHTPLHAAHLALGAKMMDFGGWDMPLSYGSQIEEHHAVRREAGMFDVSHMCNIDIHGAQASAFLRRLLANDVAKLNVPGKALYACMLNPQGGVIDDLIVYFFAPDRWRVVVNAGCAPTDLVWMQEVARAFDVALQARRDLAMLAVQGPQARARFWAVRPQWQAATQALEPFCGVVVADDTLVARTGYTGEDGFEVVLPASPAQTLWADLHAQGVRPCGLGARDTLRLEAGMNLYGQDMDQSTRPGESALSWTVALKDPQRDFIGRAAIEHQVPGKVLLGIKLRERGVIRPHMAVRTAQGLGEVTSGTMSPTLGVSIGFVRVPAGAQAGDTVQVEIRGKWLQADLVKPPFVRHGQAVQS